MLHILAGAVLLIACTAPFLLREVTLPSQMSYMLDFAIAASSVLVVGRLIANAGWAKIPIEYVLVFLGFLYVAVAGIVINDVSSLVVFAGVRTYFKFVPVFLIPFAFMVGGPQIKIQLKFLIGICLLQFPATLYQRFFSTEAQVDVLGGGETTGDLVRGTLTTSSGVAVLCAAAIVMLAAFYIRRRISLVTTFTIALLFLIPTAFAETKVTPIFLALGGLGVVLVLHQEIAVKRLMALLTSGAVLLGAFAFSYDQLYSPGQGEGYLQYMTDANRTGGYNLQGARAKQLSALKENSNLVAQQAEATTTDVVVGRFDGLRLPFDALWPTEFLRLLMGLGIGNVDSSLGPGGSYRNIKRHLGGTNTSLAMLLWETGVLGTSLFLVFSLLVARDFLRLTTSEGIMGALGAGMFGASLIFLFSLAYTNVFHQPEIMATYAYLGGVAAACNQRRVTVRQLGYKKARENFTPLDEPGHHPT